MSLDSPGFICGDEEVSFETKVLSSGWKTDWISKVSIFLSPVQQGEMVEGGNKGPTPERTMLVAATENHLFNHGICPR